MGTTQVDSRPETKYWHLKTVLLEALDTEFAVGEVLPNERALAARFGVARATLRQALEQLELEGRLQRRRGVGTTVAPPRIGVDIGPGAEHTWPGAPGDDWQLEAYELQEPSGEIAKLLDDPSATAVHTLRRTRVTAGQPVAAETLYVPFFSVPEAESVAEGVARGRAVLAALGELTLESQDRAVELGSARAEEARQLERLPGAPMLVVTTSYLAQGRTVAVSVATYRADTCRLTFADSGAISLAAS